ncbi:MAG: ArdC-like ssDNA-binding domain-containing protein, partial [Sphingopyxis sp.]|uniref:ArdC-like ssDNA-binding domain-containing protein n=1 Tax=Sphingopyxis sp. TaxID=1908224 RepID=UPI004036979A
HDGGTVMRPTSAVGRAYTGINRLVLWASAEAHGFQSGTWATYRQWTEVGAQVRRGETGTHVILWKKQERDEPTSADSDGEERSARFFARSFVVFNQSQVDGSPERTLASARPIGETAASAKLFLESVGVPVHYGPWDAYFRPDEDRVYMPDREAFDSDEDFISTLGHEIVHSTGSAQRLARETLRDYFKDRTIRAREELVALSGQSAPSATLQ